MLTRERVIKLYQQGRLTKKGLRNAVKMQIITSADYKQLTGEDYDEMGE